MAARSDSKKMIGAALTIIGLLLLAYSVFKGLVAPTTVDNDKGINLIGSKESASIDAISVILGWFAILIGPALWLGETPAVIRKQARRG